MFAPGVPDGKVSELTKITLQDWKNGAWIWGAPSAILPLGILTEGEGAARDLRSVVGNVHFVGTETGEVWKAYMEGQLGLGEGERRRLLMRLVGVSREGD